MIKVILEIRGMLYLGFPKFSELSDYYYYVVLNMTSRVNTSLPHRGDRYKHMSVEQDRQNCQLIR